MESRIRGYESEQVVAREQMEQAMGRARALEAALREREEELFEARRVAAARERDAENMCDTENGLKMEIQRAASARQALEEQIQELRQRTVADQIMVRLRENEGEGMSREIKSMKGVIEGLQGSMAQVMRENDQLKAALNEHERNNIQMKSLF